MKAILRSIGHGFAGLLRFGGRDSRLDFWPYAALIVFFAQTGGMLTMLPVLTEFQRFILELPRVSGPPDIGAAMAATVGPVILVNAASVALLAAAVARRLHDRDRRGYWGLLPVPFLAASLALMPSLFAGFATRDGVPEPWPLLALILNNLAYFAALGFLIVLLAGEGTRGPNRFGPPPA